MIAFRLSRRAETDLVDIGGYTFRVWDHDQTVRCCRILADNPMLGRECDNIRPGLRRLERGRHVVFYRPADDGILVSRILHQRTLPEKQAIEDDLGPEFFQEFGQRPGITCW